jgi:hypothetical protein
MFGGEANRKLEAVAGYNIGGGVPSWEPLLGWEILQPASRRRSRPLVLSGTEPGGAEIPGRWATARGLGEATQASLRARSRHELPPEG